jgi:hypothetical protein
MLSDRKELAPCLSRRMANRPANRVSLHSTDNRNNPLNMDSRNRPRRVMDPRREATSRNNPHPEVTNRRSNPRREATSNNTPRRPLPAR